MITPSHLRPSSRFTVLTDREAEVFDMVVIGYSNKQCANELGISSRTVEVFRRRLMAKLRAETFAELMWLGLFGYKAPSSWE